MARLESQAKLGFYPTPPEIVRQIKSMLKISPSARLLDTCCGEGEALSILAEGVDVETCGVELDKNRFIQAQTRLDHVLWGDAIYELICPKNFCSLLFLNPPYDSSDSEKDHTRIEVQFLNKHWRYLMDGGVLVYIIPFGSLNQAAPTLTRNCRNLTILRFSDEYFYAFEQIVVVCVKGRPTPSEIKENASRLRMAVNAYSEHELFRLCSTEIASEFAYDVPAAENMDGLVLFRSVRFNPGQCMEKLKKSPVWNRVHPRLFPAELAKSIQPLTSLREGHLAMLLASGIMNGEVMGSDEQRLIVKGSVVKSVTITTEELEKQTRILHTDRYDITVRAICFDPTEIITIKQ